MLENPGLNVCVIGIGAMGGAMARALLEADAAVTVTGFDAAAALVAEFHRETTAAGKALMTAPPATLRDAVTTATDVAVLVLQTEEQCEAVCFGTSGSNDGAAPPSLLDLLTAGDKDRNVPRCVILCSTVAAAWTRRAAVRFTQGNVAFVDCPMSGGPARARAGDLTLMASGDDASLAAARPILTALGGADKIHIVPGGPGMGSTMKAVHQLLAGVHIAVAAEALALAAKAGLDVRQVYEVVNGAAGASWMFQDRGQRMMEAAPPVKSQLQIFVKDLDIVHAEAKRLHAPTPIASAALQQFIAGVGLGLGKADDSKVVRVYENVTGAQVCSANQGPSGDKVGDLWAMDDGTSEEIVEVGLEPRHKVVISNPYVRALRVAFPPNDTTVAHRHAEDSLYFFLVDGLTVVNHVKGQCPMCDAMEFGEIRFGAHKSQAPLVHKITNTSDKEMLCIDAELLQQPPVTSVTGLLAEKHELIKTRDKCRVYKLTLEPGESVEVSYPFFYLSVVLEPSTIRKVIAGPMEWTETVQVGDIAWKEPIVNIRKTNIGPNRFIEYIAEWR